jgi:hypothetical protein
VAKCIDQAYKHKYMFAGFRVRDDNCVSCLYADGTYALTSRLDLVFGCSRSLKLFVIKAMITQAKIQELCN